MTDPLLPFSTIHSSSDLSNDHHGPWAPYDWVVDVLFGRGSIFATREVPTDPTKFVMSAGFGEQYAVVHTIYHRYDRGATYRLCCVRKKCPVLFFGGDRCPVCGGDHVERR